MMIKKKKEVVLIFGHGEMGQVFEKNITPAKADFYIWDIQPKRQVMKKKSLVEVASLATMVIMCVPSWELRNSLNSIKKYLSPKTVLFLISKGLEFPKLLLPNQIAKEVFPKNPIAYIAGPMLSEEILRGVPASALCCTNKSIFIRFKNIISQNIDFSFISENNINSVAWCGILKNVYAMYLGLLFERTKSYNQIGANLPSVLIEMRHIISEFKGNPHLAETLIGLGDLIATGMSPDSSNRLAATCLMRGESKRTEGSISLVALKKIFGKNIKKYPYLSFLTLSCGAQAHRSITKK